MNIYLYGKSLWLPQFFDYYKHDFWKRSEAQIQVFDSKTFNQWQFLDTKSETLIPFSNHQMYPIFKALSELDCFPDLCAHISFPLNAETLVHKEGVELKIQVQFSTLPQYIEGVPQILSDKGESIVEPLWSCGPKILSPYCYLDPTSQMFDPSIHTVDFWKCWFIDILLDYREDRIEEANQQIKDAEHVISLFRNFPKKEDISM